MRPVKVRPRWRCDFCRRTSSSVESMKTHEKICWRNPNRVCDQCQATGVQVHDYTGAEEPCYYCSQFNPDIAGSTLGTMAEAEAASR